MPISGGQPGGIQTLSDHRLLSSRAPGLVLVAMLVGGSLMERAPASERRAPQVQAEAVGLRQPSPASALAIARPAPRPARVRPAAGAVTGWFGEGRRSHRHLGVDFDGETGDSVWAAAAGTVVNAGTPLPGYSGYGTVVVINHPDGFQTVYAHLSSVSVTNGQTVGAGDRIGSIGTTGHVTGSHLHFEVRHGGALLDPGPWLGGAVPPDTTPPVTVSETLWLAIASAASAL